LEHDGPAALRYPRGSGTGAILENPIRPLQIGKGETLKEGEDVLILAIGRSVCEALEAYSELSREGISATIVNCRFVKPLDIDLISNWARKIPRIITVEENIRQGGFGSAVLEALYDAGFSGFQLERIGIADTFVEHGPQAVLRSKYAVDADAIVQSAKLLMASSTRADTQWPDRQVV
ncbi:MAG: 1-deoxy-D-xylulose-5-phosphate synthase, partial [Deltaproteobacteria bacterium]|nr:1-deoxy-D-xylulose-5-phosphate synthase [Deltaproteobacteria bacterium]